MKARTIGFGIVLWFLMGSGSVLAGTELSVGPASGSPGSTVLVPIGLSSSDNPVSLQMEVRFDAGQMSSGAVLGGSALGNHVVGSSEPGSGVRRIVIYSLTNGQMTNGVISQVPLTIRAEANQGAVVVSVTNVIVVSSNGARISPVSLVSGSVSISTAGPARLGAIVRSTDGRVQFEVSGTVGRSYVIQGSTNLVQWTALSTNAVTGGAFNFVDPSAPNYSQRFYRAVLAP